MWQTGLVGDIVKRDSGQVPFGVSSGAAPEVRIYAVHIISGATAGQVKLYNGTSTSGELRYHLTCPVVSSGNTFALGSEGGALFEDGCFCEFVDDANITSATFTYYGAGTPSSSSSSSCRSSSSSSSSCRSSSSSSSSSSNSSSSSSSSCRSSSSSSLSSSSSSNSSSSSSCRSSSSSCSSSSSSNS